MKKFTLIIAIVIIANCDLFSQLKIASNGYVGINNTSPTYRLDVSGTVRLASSGKSIMYEGPVLYPASGNYVDLGTYTNYWYNLYVYQPYYFMQPVFVSDQSLKKEIKSIPEVKDRITKLNPVSYKLNPSLPDDTPEEIRTKITETLQFGFIAQEMQEFFPEIVSKEQNGVLGIQYTALIPILVKAFQEQQQQIDSLSRKIAELEKLISR
jgi:hypothetical protein